MVNGKGETQTAAEIREAIDELTELRELFENALSVAAERVKAEQAKPTKKAENKKTVPEDGVQLSINEKYAKEMLAWDGKSSRVFTLGMTSAALRSIGVKEGKIVFFSGKATDILNNPEHAMDQNALSKLPDVLENPIIILKSQQTTKDNIANNDGNTSRLVILGSLNDTKGVPVPVVLELLPKGKGGRLLNLSVIASAYGKDSNLSGFIQNSEVLYLDTNKNRTNSWLISIGVQFPFGSTNYGPIGTVTYSGDKVNIQGVPFSKISGVNYVAVSKTTPPLADWQKKLLEKLSKTGTASALSEDNGTQNSVKSGDEGASYEENGKQYSIKSLNHDIAEGQMFADLVAAKVFTEKEAAQLKDNLTRLISYMVPNADILDLNEEYGRDNRPFIAYKPNSDPLYGISLDFSALCRKRENCMQTAKYRRAPCSSRTETALPTSSAT